MKADIEEGLDHRVLETGGASAQLETLAIPPLQLQPGIDHSLLMDLSESLMASQSDLGPYWQRGVSRKRV